MAQLPIIEPTHKPPFWTVWSYGHSTYMPHDRYYWSNKDRGPHECVTFQYNLRGSCEYVERGQQFTVQQGQGFLFSYIEDTAYFLPEGRTEPYECIWLNLHGAGLREHWQYLRSQFGSIFTVPEKSSLIRSVHQLRELSQPRQNTDPLDMATAVHRLVIQITDGLRSRWQKTEPPVDQAIEQILQHPSSVMSMKSVAARYEVSREHLTRRFTEKTGIGPGQYLAQQKIIRALTLLRETTLPIGQVAEQSGFGTAHTLIRQIQTTQKMSPTQYRQQQQERE